MLDISKICQSDLHFKIISFFYENQSSVDTVKGISIWVNHRPDEVSKVLEELVNLNILMAHRSEGVTGFAYTQNKEISNSIDNYIQDRLGDQTR